MTGRVLSRRAALAGLAAGAAAVAGGIAAEERRGGSGPRPAAAMLDDLAGSYDFNQGWLFGGPYVTGAESPGHDDSGYARVTLPHTVTELSWTGWDYRAWERTWIYRKHFDSAFVAGSRVLVTFDGVMTNATVVLNGRVVATHAGGYLPWTAELTGHLSRRGNVLAVIVDGRWLDVPPDALPGGPPTMDFPQPAGICRDVRLEVVPGTYLQDVFVLPRDVLAASRTVRVTATVQAPRPRPGGIRPPVRGPDRLVRLRLLLGAAAGRRRLGTGQDLARDEDTWCRRRVPGAEARRRRLPGPGRPGGQAGDRPRVLLACGSTDTPRAAGGRPPRC